MAKVDLLVVPPLPSDRFSSNNGGLSGCRLGSEVLLVTVAILGLAPALLLAQSMDPVVNQKTASSGSAQPAPGKEDKTKESSIKNADPGKKPEEKKDDKEKEKDKEKPAPTVMTRPVKPDMPPDPSELDIRPDAQGRVRFSFSRQPWPAILEWLAEVSHLSLDWQELPADYLNLQTQRDYSLEEARDLINHHLLARGFTMLKSGEMLTVVSIAKLNLAMVPRVEPEELVKCLDSEFVKVSFPLKWMLAERAVEELKPMLSSHGKLFALKELNRVEAVDAASNLKDIRRVLQQSQSAETGDASVVKVFPLKHRRASDVVLLVESILGLESKRMPVQMGRGGGDMMSFQVMHQLQQMQQMLQQGQRGQSNNNNGKQEPEPRLIVNDQENSILAHATPDKIEIIAQTIKAIDVPGDEGNQLLHSINRVKPYRLSTADPQPLMALLKEMGNLSPQSRIQVDEKSKTLILYGTLADHFTTQSLIERIDGTNRNFEVMPLRRLRADAVAGTIQYLMGGEEEDKNKNPYNRYSYYGYQSGSSRENKEERPFRVDADVVNNRLLLWANDVELEEVRNLLTKMGETPPGQNNPQTTRWMETSSPEETRKLLEQLKQVWPEADQHPLRIQSPSPSRVLPDQSPPQTRIPPDSAPNHSGRGSLSTVAPVRLTGETGKPDTRETSEKSSAPIGAVHPLSEQSAALAEVMLPQDLAEGQGEQNGIAPQAPVTIQQLPDGRLLYHSPDPQVLDRLEDLIGQLSPPMKDYHVFQLKYPTTWAYGIELILEDFFKDESLTESTYDPWWGTTHTKVKRSNRLSQQKELKVISNDDSHTILVQGATEEQLKVIQELIDVYDRPTSSDPQALRKTEIFPLQYSKAVAIAEAVKQVYRDLLSANDPALQNPNQQKPSEEPKFTYIYGRQNTGDDKEDNPAQPIKFKGLLSVGVDEISNTVIVSSTEGLMQDIRELINRLDQAARPTHSVQVLQVRNIAPELLQQRLERAFSGPSIRSSQTGQRSQKPDAKDKSSSPEKPAPAGESAPAGNAKK